ncbi:MAG: hypothetical protein KDA99_09965 [Planctomycetales bacterium]|nr:hypothetical protein [Planctomycetales bacterium]
MQRSALFLLLLMLSWCVMTITHEMGHIIVGWAGGGTLTKVDLAPWRLPFSIFSPDPHPLCTLWGGPILGVAMPLFVAAIAQRNWTWLIAFFCLLANGVYLAASWISADQFLDTTKLLEHGAHPATIAAYCTATIGPGYWGLRRACIHYFTNDT